MGDREGQRLLQEIEQGSVSAFSRFYDLYAGLVYGIALKMTNNREDAEDICHEVFLEAFKKADKFDPTRGSVEAWLSIQTRSRCLDLLRRKQQRPIKEISAHIPGNFLNPEDQAMANLARAAVNHALERIPQLQRQALYESFFEEQSHSEMARKMNKPLGTVKSLIRYGLKNLRRQLAEDGWLQSSEGKAKKYEL